MTTLNWILSRLFDALFVPLAPLPPLASLAVISLLASILMLLVWKRTSDQAQMTAEKRLMQAGLFEIRLFNDEPRAILHAQSDILRHNLAYLRLSLTPLLWMFVPLLLVTVQLQSFYGYLPFRPGETFLLEMKVRESASADRAASTRPDAQLRLPAGLRLETADVWVPSRSEMTWRVRAELPGSYAVGLRLGNESFSKDVHVAHRFMRLSPTREQASFPEQLLHPAEPPLPDSPRLQSIQVSYAPRAVPVLRWRLPWMAVFFALVLVFSLALKNRFGVTF